MRTFKPQVTVITEESRRDYRNSFTIRSPYKTIQYDTYVELKRNLKKHLKENLESKVSVCRSIYDRGWGSYCEYVETWTIDDNGKIYKISGSLS